MADDLFDRLLDQIKSGREQRRHETKNSRLLLVDGNNLFLRAFSVSPALNTEGAHIGGIVGSLHSLGSATKRFQPTRCIVVFDGPGGSYRRRQIFEGYKEGRKPPSEKRYNRAYEFNQDVAQADMRREIGRLALYLRALPVTTMMVKNVEADDVIAYLAGPMYEDESERAVIMSTDKDFMQMVDERVRLYRPTKKLEYGPDEVEEEFGVPARHFLAYRAVLGDKSDNIDGVPYVGDKRFREKFAPLLERGEPVGWRDLVEHADVRRDESATYGRVADAADLLERNYRLMDLRGDMVSGSKRAEIRDAARADRSVLDRLAFKNLLMEDKAWNAIPNFQSYLTERFLRLDRFGGLADGEAP